MKKNLMKFAVLACVAFFALNSQSQAADVYVSFGKEKACCVENHRSVEKHKAKARHKNHCCKHMKAAKHRRHMAHSRKGCCRHGR